MPFKGILLNKKCGKFLSIVSSIFCCIHILTSIFSFKPAPGGWTHVQVELPPQWLPPTLPPTTPLACPLWLVQDDGETRKIDIVERQAQRLNVDRLLNRICYPCYCVHRFSLQSFYSCKLVQIFWGDIQVDSLIKLKIRMSKILMSSLLLFQENLNRERKSSSLLI